MIQLVHHIRVSTFTTIPARLGIAIFCGVLALCLTTFAQNAAAQEVGPAAAAESHPAPASAQPLQQTATAEISEEELRRMLVGKELFLRGGYLDNTLSFNERGELIGHSPQGSYTLSEIQINKVHLAKHKVVLEGDRYALHFLGALAYEDPTKAVDRVKITPKKKEVKITIDRELVVKQKEPKEKGKPARTAAKTSPAPPKATATGTATNTVAPAAPQAATTDAAPSNAAPMLAPPAESEQASESAEAKAEIAAAPAAERPADIKSVTTTTLPAHANNVLKDALNNVFAQGFDSRMMASMPGFWKLYYEAVEEKSDYRPNDPAVLSQSAVDKKARLVSVAEPASNEYAQDFGVAGMCLYHVVVGADGKPGEIAVGRPIGFGLDENAVDAIRKATFEPAIKDGKPIPVLLDLIVEFRIYSKRTAQAAPAQTAEKPAEPSLPGPYSVQH